MFRIWLDTACTICAVVSEEDYAWTVQWKWQITWDRHKRKAYATRSTTDCRRRVKLYLHKEILKRKGDVPPSAKHTIGDHEDADSLNCQRYNLRWVTPSQNRKTAKPPVPIKREPARQPDLPF